MAGTSLPFMRRATLPSTITITLSARRATLGSCVTTTRVRPSLVEVVEELEDRRARLRVEVAGGLVGEQDLGAVHDRARDGDALALSARELIGAVVLAPAQTDRGERLVDAAAPLDAPDAAEEERQLDVPRRGQARHQMEELEDEADLLAADAGELLVGERADLVAVETVGAASSVDRGSR